MGRKLSDLYAELREIVIDGGDEYHQTNLDDEDIDQIRRIFEAEGWHPINCCRYSTRYSGLKEAKKPPLRGSVSKCEETTTC